MFFPRTSQVFKFNKRTLFQVPTPVITEDISIPLELSGKILAPLGDFPRRVKIGEILLSRGEFFILSPVDGIAELESFKKKIKIRLDGRLNSPTEYNLREFSFTELKEKLKNLGIVSLDQKATLPIHVLLQDFQDSEDSMIVFSPFTESNFIDFKNKILEKYRAEFLAFVENIKKIFPKSKIYNFLLDTQNFQEYNYPEGDPNFFLSKYCGKSLNSKLDFRKILYLGPETTYYMIQALYYSLPFIERLISIHIINHNGFLEGEPKIYKIKNGTNITTFLSMIREKYSYKYFTINSFFEKYPVYEIGAEFVFDIYSHNAFIICEDIITSKETVCIDCNDCNYFCPVYANPRELLNRNKSLFLAEKCIECGLCSVFCPSHIDFSRRIKELKEELRLALS